VYLRIVWINLNFMAPGSRAKNGRGVKVICVNQRMALSRRQQPVTVKNYESATHQQVLPNP
jgi:hypothetical protein